MKRCSFFFTTTEADGKTYQVDHNNLDIIIPVGYRVKSLGGTQLRIWANTIVKKYMIKGFAIGNTLQSNIDWKSIPCIHFWHNLEKLEKPRFPPKTLDGNVVLGS